MLEEKSEMLAEKSTSDFAVEGLKCLEDTIGAAFKILSSMNDELCNPNLWSSTTTTTSSTSNGINGSDDHHSEGGGAIEVARLRYKSTVASLRSVLVAIVDSQKAAKRKENYEVQVMITPGKHSALDGNSGTGQHSRLRAKAYDAGEGSAFGMKCETNQSEMEQLEERANNLRKEIADKNMYVKVLIDQLRELICDISTWQSPCSA
ncbi:hypothetical protein GIB67_021421 [Kingdonia uniflora]|uniref:Mediator of RNA polymerase II transcription subunit 30 n=1 Tax=Kingdonia uniflora TaxID=39325 RepID=A0A7J7NCN4_9MAGN|nr:hypothetical protein GIB67_021421 [Kingdonia uniflora]